MMSSLAKSIFTIAVLIEVRGIMVAGLPNTNVTTVLCNSGVYTSGDPFAISRAYVLADLIEATPPLKGRDYFDISPFPNAFAYGHATCRARLPVADCSACLRAAAGLMNSTCAMRIGARAVLFDCNIRYEQYPFVN